MNTLQWLHQETSRHFYVIESRSDHDAIIFFVDVQPDEVEVHFDALRRTLTASGFIPMLVKEGGEYLLYVTRKPDATYRSTSYNKVFLVATIASTIFVGTINWSLYQGQQEFWSYFTATNVLNGAIFFALPLMLILGIHEMGHYVLARRHGVAASLPFFIPVPLPPLGTFGAFISMRDPIPDNKALMDIGVSGPIAGFIVAVPVTLLGLHLTNVGAQPLPADAAGLVDLGISPLFYLFLLLVPTTGDYVMHPTALAGWAGLLVTFLNLLPAGQLDGGHISRAMFGHRAKYLGYGVIVMMLVLTVVSGYPGWIVFVILILLLGVNHPPPLNDITKLRPDRFWALGVGAFVLLAATFTIAPLVPVEPTFGVTAAAHDEVLNLEPRQTVLTNVSVSVTGNSPDQVRASLDPFALGALARRGWNVSLVRTWHGDGTYETVNTSRLLTLKVGTPTNVTVVVTAPSLEQEAAGTNVSVPLLLKSRGDSHEVRLVTLQLRLGTLHLSSDVRSVVVVPHGASVVPLLVRHLGKGNASAELSWDAPAGWVVTTSQASFTFSGEASEVVEVTLGLPGLPPAGPSGDLTFTLTGRPTADANGTVPTGGEGRNITLNLTIATEVAALGGVSVDEYPAALDLVAGTEGTFSARLANTGNVVQAFSVTVRTDPALNLTVSSAPPPQPLSPGQNVTVSIGLRPAVGTSGSGFVALEVEVLGDGGVSETAVIHVDVG